MSSFRPVRTLLAAALAFAAAPALAQTYSQTVFFGDSLTDSGYFRPLLPANVRPLTGQFTTNPGWVWSQYVADYYGASAAPNGNGQTGPNYAAGGANISLDTSGALGPIPSLFTQATRYLAANGGRADPKALYTVWGGANDLFAFISFSRPTVGGPNGYANTVFAHAYTVNTLQAAGARYVLVPTIPDLGLTPSFRAQGPAAMAGATAFANQYNNDVFAALNTAGLRVIPLDTFHFLQEAVANPGLYGFSNVTGTACQPQITANSLTCNPTSYVNADAPNTYLFADGVHPSTAAHKILSELAISALEGPRQIALLSHSAGTIGRARADRVSAHLGGKPDADGMRWWSDVRGDSQRYDKGNSGAGFDGGGPTLTFGVDWASGNLVYGAFAGYGRQKIDFGARGGEFDQADTSLGGFLAWHGDDGLWANAQVSYTKLAFDVDRKVKLGPATRTHSGSPDGDNLSVGIDAGWEFGDGALRHGPVIGLLSQQIDIDGYAESEPALSSSLAFPEQNVDSLIGSAGWQASYAINDHLKPYAQLTYDHEFEDQAEEAFARAQSLPGTGTYAVPGPQFDGNYGTLLLGAQSKLFGLDANIGASVTLGQEGGNDASVFATIGKGF